MANLKPAEATPLEKASEILLERLQGESCELTIWQVAQIARDHEVPASHLLGMAEENESCQVDYATGRIVCTVLDPPAELPQDYPGAAALAASTEILDALLSHTHTVGQSDESVHPRVAESVQASAREEHTEGPDSDGK